MQTVTAHHAARRRPRRRGVADRAARRSRSPRREGRGGVASTTHDAARGAAQNPTPERVPVGGRRRRLVRPLRPSSPRSASIRPSRSRSTPSQSTTRGSGPGGPGRSPSPCNRGRSGSPSPLPAPRPGAPAAPGPPSSAAPRWRPGACSGLGPEAADRTSPSGLGRPGRHRDRATRCRAATPSTRPWGAACCWCWAGRGCGSTGWHRVAVGVAVVIVIVTALDRMLLGVHYLSDVTVGRGDRDRHRPGRPIVSPHDCAEVSPPAGPGRIAS